MITLYVASRSVIDRRHRIVIPKATAAIEHEIKRQTANQHLVRAPRYTVFTPVDMASVPSLLVRIGEQIDILFELADSLIEDKAFRTLASLSATSRCFRDELQPLLKRTRKRIVVGLSEMCDLEVERYRDIQ
jgi:hypothetical protein